MASARFGLAALIAIAVWVATPRAASFSNTAAISIPSGPGNATPYPSPITVSGLSGTVKKIRVTITNFSHTFSDDVGIVLVGPGGQALLLMDGVGNDPDVSGVTLTFADGAPLLPDDVAPTSGTYKPTTYYEGDSFPAPGPLTVYNNPGPAGGGTATLATTFNGTNPNGTWNLFVRDFASGDAGSITGGWSLTIVVDAPFDFDGNGVTDFAVLRNTGGGPSGAVTWFWWTGASLAADSWGIAADSFVPSDFDGDGKADVAVWRPGNPGIWYIHRSSDQGVTILAFGQTGDDASVAGDYDGDGKADQAVYRAGATAGAQSFWHVWRSATGTPFSAQWGQNGDFLVPGDYDGDGKTDVAVLRPAGAVILWHIRRSSDGGYTVFSFGAAATDLPTQGDYDGDGITDVAVWRPDAVPSQTAFFVRWSSDGSFHAFQFGQGGDYPLANVNVH